MATINITIWILIILFVIVGIYYFIHPPKGDYGHAAGFAFGVSLYLLIIYIVLMDKL